jgi:hypothetical protein
VNLVVMLSQMAVGRGVGSDSLASARAQYAVNRGPSPWEATASTRLGRSGAARSAWSSPFIGTRLPTAFAAGRLRSDGRSGREPWLSAWGLLLAAGRTARGISASCRIAPHGATDVGPTRTPSPLASPASALAGQRVRGKSSIYGGCGEGGTQSPTFLSPPRPFRNLTATPGGGRRHHRLRGVKLGAEAPRRCKQSRRDKRP